MKPNESFLQQLACRVLICDGAMGTLLFARGVSRTCSCDSVTLSRPDLVTEIHREYIEAGADVIETNTFGANSLRLRDYGLSQKTRDINRQAVNLAHSAREKSHREVFIAGSIGPTGSQYAKTDESNDTVTRDALSPQIEGLLTGGVDLFVLETFSDLVEIEVAVNAIRSQSSLPIVAQMTFNADMQTLTGATPAQCARRLAQLPVDIIGLNCSCGPRQVQALVRQFASATNRPLSAMPNAGLPRLMDEVYIYDIGPDEFAACADDLIDAGVRLIGGCCGTTPAHIRRLAASVRQR